MRAAQEGRVDALFLRVDVDVPGTFDPESGEVVVHESEEDGDVDLASLAARLAFASGGQIFSAGPPDLDEDSGMGGLFRY